jgi:transketolase
MSSSHISDLRQRCCSVKQLLLNLHYNARSGHVGSALSCAEILTFLKFHCVSEADSLVLSKGHAASALYSVLSIAGDIDSQELLTNYYRDGTLFSAHPPPNKIPFIPFATGSLGHGAGIAAGLALGLKLKESQTARVFCVLSDGELNEGSVWEAFAFSVHHRLKNLVFVIDQNGLQGFGRTKDVFNMEPLADKLRSFGLAVGECDGHDFEALESTYAHTISESSCLAVPSIVVAKTTKGRGLVNLADTVDCHYLPMTTEVYEAAVDFCRRELLRTTYRPKKREDHAS